MATAPLCLELDSLWCSFREIVGKKVVRALKRKDDGISHACIDFLCALMQPMHDNYDLRQEQYNKRSLLSSKGFLNMLLEPLKEHVVSCGCGCGLGVGVVMLCCACSNMAQEHWSLVHC